MQQKGNVYMHMVLYMALKFTYSAYVEEALREV
jgi:hypothetical protein